MANTSVNPTVTSLALAILALAPATARSQGCPVQPGDFKRTQLVGNELNEPMELEVDHEDNVYWVERKTGRLRVFDAKAKKVVEAATLSTYANGSGSSGNHSAGVIGLALAPDFAASRKLYINYSPEPVGGKQKLRVSRFTLNGLQMDPASEEVIIEFDASFTCCHQGGSLEFGPDGVLYIGTGDNWNTVASDPASWAVPYATSMGPQNLNGKILRILPKPGPGGGYTVPAGNLFASPAAGRPEIYVMGTRNAYRINADPRTGWIYWGDIGPDGPRMEEFNQTRNEPGNYGWPAVIGENEPTPGNSGYAALKDQLPPLKVPLISYNGTTDLVHTGAAGTTGMGIRGRAAWVGPVYYYDGRSTSQNRFPPSFHGTVLTYDWHLGWIKAIHFNSEGYVASVAPFTDFTWVHMIDMEFSPSGELYVLDYGSTYRVNNTNDGLYKISYHPADPAACLPAAPELDAKTIGNAKPAGIRTASGRRAGGAAFAVRSLGGAYFAEVGGLFQGRIPSGEIVIRDLSGRVAETVAIRSAAGLVPLPAMRAGVYVLEINSPSGKHAQKAFLTGK